MPSVPKYQAIHSVLRARILDGELAPGEKLPPQPELAESFGVTLMTLRQAVAALEAEGLVRAAHGKGTFVADRPVDITLGNLSSFAEQMRSAGVAMATEVLDVSPAESLGLDTLAGRVVMAAASALGSDADLIVITRRRSADGEPFALQRSVLAASVVGLADGESDIGESLYERIEATTGWAIARAEESITAVALADADADLLSTAPGHPALESIRTSFNQFDRPFLYDEALLVGGRSSIAADRTSDRLRLTYGQ